MTIGLGFEGSRQRFQDPDKRRWIFVLLLAAVMVLPGLVSAQSPELAMREFASGQVKKGVRSLGFGGDGATWGNYGLVWKDAGTAIVDYGDTQFTNDNDFHFSAIGATTPPLWHDLAVYLIFLQEGTNDVHFKTKSPGLGPNPVPVTGTGADHAIFSKIAMPLGNGFSAGVLLSYETSEFSAVSDANPGQTVHYETQWRPSGGFGVAWQPNKTWLVGFRALLNTDDERRTDPAGVTEGTARSQEFRLGVSVAPWDGGLIDVGATHLEKKNSIAGTHTTDTQPNLGFEQALMNRRLVLRIGRDETSDTAGFTWKFAPFDLGMAYVHNMAHARVGDLFGTESNSVMLTLGVDYRAFGSSPQAH
jgi:hypothetical protein